MWTHSWNGFLWYASKKKAHGIRLDLRGVEAATLISKWIFLRVQPHCTLKILD